jgi:hypothetical protein
MPIAGEPKYTTVTIVPNPEKLTPVAPVAPVGLQAPTPTAATANTKVDNSQQSLQAIINANAASYGLAIARSRRQIMLSKPAEYKTQNAIALIRQGKSIESAAVDADVPVALLRQLIILGGQAE